MFALIFTALSLLLTVSQIATSATTMEDSIKTIVVFGSTGQTGLAAIEAAEKQNYTIRAFVRETSTIPENWGTKVQKYVGNVLDYNTVEPAVKGVDGVVVALGTRNDLKPTTDLSEGLKNIIKAMKAHNVTKISVCLSSFLFYPLDKVPKIFVDLNAEHQRMYDVVSASGLDYIAVLPPHIENMPGGNYTVIHEQSPGRVISKYDLGEFLVISLSKPDHYCHKCGLAVNTN